MPGYVVYDCDTGTDDAWGLLMLTKAEGIHNKNDVNVNSYKILGVTCVHGNSDVDNTTKNTLRMLSTVNRLDIPVYKGCANPILPTTRNRKDYFHGRDGFGDLEHEEIVDESLIQPQHAVNAMYEFACKYPKMVDYILVGPLTNFATCINLYGNAFLDKVRNIYIMGGNYRTREDKNGITKIAEFNFMMDPEAVHIVLKSVRSPLFLLPWETCIDVDLTLEWRFKVLGDIPSKAMELLTRAENNIFVSKDLINWIVYDAILVAAYVFPSYAIEKSRLYHTTVQLTGTHTTGQIVLGHPHDNENNATVIMKIHREHFRDIISWTAGLEVACMEQQL